MSVTRPSLQTGTDCVYRLVCFWLIVFQTYCDDNDGFHKGKTNTGQRLADQLKSCPLLGLALELEVPVWWIPSVNCNRNLTNCVRCCQVSCLVLCNRDYRHKRLHNCRSATNVLLMCIGACRVYHAVNDARGNRRIARSQADTCTKWSFSMLCF